MTTTAQPSGVLPRRLAGAAAILSYIVALIALVWGCIDYVSDSSSDFLPGLIIPEFMFVGSWIMCLLGNIGHLLAIPASRAAGDRATTLVWCGINIAVILVTLALLLTEAAGSLALWLVFAVYLSSLILAIVARARCEPRVPRMQPILVMLLVCQALALAYPFIAFLLGWLLD